MIRLADLARRIWCCDSYQLTLLCIFPSDVFKIPLSKIEVSQSYQTRKANNSFVDDIKKAMLEELSLDSVVYLVSVVNPFDENNILKEDSRLYILGGTHYL